MQKHHFNLTDIVPPSLQRTSTINYLPTLRSQYKKHQQLHPNASDSNPAKERAGAGVRWSGVLYAEEVLGAGGCGEGK